ncbi:MAG: hypothetical protein H6581_24900 [Bacteroidia bacterium]|nr:hypothetical protein [Bacteroidia bacterium]
MAENNTLATLARELGSAFQPLGQAISSLPNFENFMARLGWNVSVIPAPISALAGAVNTLVTRLTTIVNGGFSENDVLALMNAVKDLVAAIKAIESAGAGLFPVALIADGFLAKFPRQLIDYLLVEYLTLQHGQVGYILGALGIIRIKYVEPVGNRLGYFDKKFAFEDLPKILDDPLITIKNAYNWGQDDFDAQGIMRHVDDLLVVMGAHVWIERPGDDEITALSDGAPSVPVTSRRALKASFFDLHNNLGHLQAGIGLFAVPKVGARKPGFSLLPFAEGAFQQRVQILETLFFLFKAEFEIQGGIGLLLRPDEGLKIITGFNDPASATSASGNLKMRLENKKPNGTPIIVIGTADGSRLEYQSLSLEGGVYVDSTSDPDLYVETELEGGKLVVKPGNDGFLSKILPADGIGANFDLALGWSNQRGVYFRGSGGLELNIPTHVDLGPVQFQSITVGLGFESGLQLTAGASVAAQLGPLAATVQNMGIKADLTFPGSGGNMGPVNLDLDFKPPSGVGLSVDGGGFKGGGFLEFDPANGRYTGLMELEFQNTIAIKAIGLLTTKMPDGSDGFSLLIIISAEFTPIQLGFGFSLNGVGGLLGLNRTMVVDKLREGVRTGSLNSVLFPTNIIANANRIISDLRAIFPPREGQFIFGAMAKIGWGVPTLLTVEMGLILEVPESFKFVILGVVRAILPDENAPILKIQVNFLGAFEADKKLISFDASLFDSRLLSMTLSGDMALRIAYGDNPNFLITVGGFHPVYNPPPLNLPELRRLTINLLGGNNPKLTLETYFAITSNTVQFGARIDLLVKVWKFKVVGWLAFDALFQFSPFWFIVSISAGVKVMAGSSTLFSITLKLSLEGPTPWKANGTASFRILFVKVKVKFNKTWGEEKDTRLPDKSVLAELRPALADQRNWQAQLPSRSKLQVTLRELPPSESGVIAHPAGTLTVSQKVVPLSMHIDKFGAFKPSDGNKFEIGQVLSKESPADPGEDLNDTPVREEFAPAQFQDLKETEKLSAKSFENLPAGVKISTGTEEVRSHKMVLREVEYETIIIDKNFLRVKMRSLLQMAAKLFGLLWRGGAVAQTAISHAKTKDPVLAESKVKVAQEGFAVVGMKDLKAFDPTSLLPSQAEANAYLNELVAQDPSLAKELQVVPHFEMNHS